MDPTILEATLPSTARDVVHSIRSSSAESFAALRHAAEAARALHPPPGSLPPSLPAFVLPSHTLVPGERAGFILFEPRYVALARQVLGLSGGGSSAPPDCRFAHLPDATVGGMGVIASIVSHQALPDGRVAVNVLAGPRCVVTQHARHEAVSQPKEADAPPPPLLHVEYSLTSDDPPPDTATGAADLATGRQCLDELTKLVPGSLSSLRSVPPLLCAERLSFWLCAVILRQDDSRQRRAWLHERSTTARLAFVRNALERAAEARAERRG